MFKIFFATFFIAELIIALAVILKIYGFNKRVNALNKAILASQGEISSVFVDLRFILKEFNENFAKLKILIQKKREEYLFRFIKTSIIYISLFFLRGKYKKTMLTYQIGKEIYEAIQEC